MDGPDPRATYDRIAEHFAATREHPWPEVESFVATADPAGLALDVGCGNGRHAEVLGTVADHVVGVDASRGIIGAARRRSDRREFAIDPVQGDAATLPVRDDRVDLAAYVATLHHLRPRATRVASLDELARVLAPGGRALVGVWSTTHDRFDTETGFDTTVDWTLPDGETVPRYYHIYDPAEFDRDVGASALVVRDTFRSSGNCYVVVGASRE
jgi:SAM-dependent methyltransferase